MLHTIKNFKKVHFAAVFRRTFRREFTFLYLYFYFYVLYIYILYIIYYLCIYFIYLYTYIEDTRYSPQRRQAAYVFLNSFRMCRAPYVF